MRTKYFSGKYSKPLPPPDLNISPYKRRLLEQDAIAKTMKEIISPKDNTGKEHRS